MKLTEEEIDNIVSTVEEKINKQIDEAFQHIFDSLEYKKHKDKLITQNQLEKSVIDFCVEVRKDTYGNYDEICDHYLTKFEHYLKKLGVDIPQQE